MTTNWTALYKTQYGPLRTFKTFTGEIWVFYNPRCSCERRHYEQLWKMSASKAPVGPAQAALHHTLYSQTRLSCISCCFARHLLGCPRRAWLQWHSWGGALVKLGHWAHGQWREGGSDTTLASGTAKPQPPEKTSGILDTSALFNAPKTIIQNQVRISKSKTYTRPQCKPEGWPQPQVHSHNVTKEMHNMNHLCPNKK